MGLLILRRKDFGTRNDFLGESSGPYIWGKEKCTLGSWGRQGELFRHLGALVPAGPGPNLGLCVTAEALPFHESAQRQSDVLCVGTEILRWESLAFASDSAASG
jgi:hypothetical protein